LYSSPNIIREIRWAGHVHVWGIEEVCTGFWCGKQNEVDHLEDLGLDGRRILKLLFKNTVKKQCERH
jgi:hypothetical protein